MISLQDYSKSNYYNSFQSNIENKVILEENELIKTYGKEFDSILYKINLCQYRSINPNYISESDQDVEFNIDEQFAIRDILVNTCMKSIEEMLIENDIELPINEGFGSISDFLNRAGEAIKDKAKDVKHGLKQLGDKFKKLKEFIISITKKAIKSAKELVDKFLEMMESIGMAFGKLIEKLGGDADEFENELKTKLQEAVEHKDKRPKDNIYESIQNYLNGNEIINEDEVFEFLGFGKKKDKEEKKETNEYDDAKNAKSGGKSKLIGVGKTLLKILKSVALSVFILIIVPAIAGCIFGPAVALIVATISKTIMTGVGAYKLLKNIVTTVKSDTWKNKWKEQGWKGKLKKAGMIMLWCGMGFLLFLGAKKSVQDWTKIYDAVKNDCVKQLVPDKMVQEAMKWIDNLWKSMTGHGTPGYEQLEKIQNGLLTETTKVDNSESGDKNNDFKGSEKFDQAKTNDLDTLRNNTSDEYAQEVKSKVIDPNMTKSVEVHKGIEALTGEHVSKGTNILYADSNMMSSEGRKVLGELMQQGKVDVSQISNDALRGATNGNAGTVFQITLSPDSGIDPNDLINSFKAGAGNHSTWFHLVQGTMEAPPTEITTTLQPIAGGFAPIVALPILAKKKIRKGFLLRLGSSRSGNNIYPIKENGVQGMTFVDLKSKYGDKNQPVIDAMAKEVNKNYKTLEETKKKLEAKNKRTKEEKKILKAINKMIEKMKEGKNEYECLVFFSDTVVEKTEEPTSTNENLNEGFGKWFGGDKAEKEKLKEDTPIMFFNPMIMACGDLYNITKKKGPRKKPIYMKGLYASYEFLPTDKGMSEEEIKDMLHSFVTESFKTAWNMTADCPCRKEGNRYIENEDSPSKGKERDDFGKFTNTEITEIFNDPSSIDKYMGGAYKKGSSTLEKNNTQKTKERQDRAYQEIKDEITNNEKVKDLIEKSKTLKKKLMNDDGSINDEEVKKLAPSLWRMETNYAKGKTKKKGFFGKLKSWLFGDDDNDIDKDDYDAEELKNLAYTLASAHKKKLKRKKISESLSDEEYFEIEDEIRILTENMNILENEFVNYCLYDELINESEDNIELIDE